MTIDDVTQDSTVQPRCFFDVEIGGISAGRIVFELFYNKTPKTAENFRALCAGDKGIGKTTEKPLHYKNTVFHRVIKGFMIQGGDFSNGNGTGGESIYGGTFEDENFDVKHEEPYLLSMANRGPATNGSQFFILTQPAPHLNGVHVVFGRVVSGQAIVKQIEGLPVDRKSRPLQDVRISNSGELVLLKRKKEKKSKEVKVKPIVRGDASSGEITDDSNSGSEPSKKKKIREEKDDDDDKEIPHPLAVVREIDQDEIPPDPSNRFLMRGKPDKDKDEKSIMSEKDGKDKKKGRRSRSSRSRSRERGHDGDRDRGKRDYRTRDIRDRDRGFNRLNDGRRFGNYPVSAATGKKIKGRGKICYREPSSSRSRSRTPPHWKAETRKTISMKEFEEKEKMRREREEELRRRQEERQKRHQDIEREKEAKQLAAQTLMPGIDKDRNEIQEETTAAIVESPPGVEGDGVVFYQHLFKKTIPEQETKECGTRKEQQPEIDYSKSNTDCEFIVSETNSTRIESADFLIEAATMKTSSVNPLLIYKSNLKPEDVEEERRLRNELLKKRFKAWEESSGDDDNDVQHERPHKGIVEEGVALIKDLLTRPPSKKGFDEGGNSSAEHSPEPLPPGEEPRSFVTEKSQTKTESLRRSRGQARSTSSEGKSRRKLAESRDWNNKKSVDKETRNPDVKPDIAKSTDRSNRPKSHERKDILGKDKIADQAPTRSVSKERKEQPMLGDRRNRSRSAGRRNRSRSPGKRNRSKSFDKQNRSRSFGRRNRSRSFGRRNRSRSIGRRNRSRSTGRRNRSRSTRRRDHSNSPGRNIETSNRNRRDKSRDGRYDRNRQRRRNSRSRSPYRRRSPNRFADRRRPRDRSHGRGSRKRSTHRSHSSEQKKSRDSSNDRKKSADHSIAKARNGDASSGGESQSKKPEVLANSISPVHKESSAENTVKSN